MMGKRFPYYQKLILSIFSVVMVAILFFPIVSYYIDKDMMSDNYSLSENKTEKESSEKTDSKKEERSEESEKILYLSNWMNTLIFTIENRDHFYFCNLKKSANAEVFTPPPEV